MKNIDKINVAEANVYNRATNDEVKVDIDQNIAIIVIEGIVDRDKNDGLQVVSKHLVISYRMEPF